MIGTIQKLNLYIGIQGEGTNQRFLRHLGKLDLN